MNNSFFIFKNNKVYLPKDDTKYIIPRKAIQDTEKILKKFGTLSPSNEGLVYWGGHKNKNIITVSIVIAPKIESSCGKVTVSNRANFEIVRKLNENKLVQIAQVHSHPGKWVNHSYVDDILAAFKVNGLLSIVVPNYCINGMLPLITCGIHKYSNWKFIRIPKKYIYKNFEIKNNLNSFLEDFNIW